ncbi:MAG: DUF3459 domain-containing protein [Alphaproteobacteria bacterium]
MVEQQHAWSEPAGTGHSAASRRLEAARALQGVRGFGPVWQGDGVVFRLWAPAVSEVTLLLPERRVERAQAMERDDEGWFSLPVDNVPAGTLYGFRLEDGVTVPDPASRYQPRGIHAHSAVVDASAYRWETPDWPGRPWHEAVLYEIHVGTFSPEGSFDGVRRRLGRLAACGVTTLVLLPVAACAGARNWGYDAVLPYAPSANYGRPDDLKRLIDAAHGAGLMVLLDVDYSRFGPDGNYLPRYAPAFFVNPDTAGPEPLVIDFSCRPVREFFIRNALYWLEEFRADGLRLHGVNRIHDTSLEHILYEMRRRVDERFLGERPIHLILENAENGARYLDRDLRGNTDNYTAQRNDDFHYAMMSAVTDASDGIYGDFAPRPVAMLARCLAQGFAFQGEVSAATGRPRGEPSGHLPPEAFISYLESADALGARTGGHRLSRQVPPPVMHAALSLMLLAPMPPQLFMGEEWGAEEPFPVFFDYPDAAQDPNLAARRPNPAEASTFDQAVLDWCRRADQPHAERLEFVRALLTLRHSILTPRLEGMTSPAIEARAIGMAGHGETGLFIRWVLGDNANYTLLANLGPEEIGFAVSQNLGRQIFSTHPNQDIGRSLPAWYVSWHLGGVG